MGHNSGNLRAVVWPVRVALKIDMPEAVVAGQPIAEARLTRCRDTADQNRPHPPEVTPKRARAGRSRSGPFLRAAPLRLQLVRLPRRVNADPNRRAVRRGRCRGAGPGRELFPQAGYLFGGEAVGTGGVSVGGGQRDVVPRSESCLTTGVLADAGRRPRPARSTSSRYPRSRCRSSRLGNTRRQVRMWLARS